MLVSQAFDGFELLAKCCRIPTFPHNLARLGVELGDFPWVCLEHTIFALDG